MGSKDILQQVKKTYSAIAYEFDATRDRPWPEFKVFLEEIKRRFINKKRLAALDVGCGNGRLSHFLKNYPIEYIGIDNNRIMLRIAKKKNPKARFRYADTCKLPFSAHSFDTVWSIALLHHLPTKKLRLQALKEMKRVLKPGGLLCLTVWNLWQKKYKKYIDTKTHHAQIPWGQNKKILRYYYAFRATELRDLLKKSGFRKIKQFRPSYRSTPLPLYNLSFIAYEES
jgi:ubiquinone/menaquinone biosynthesis C-methylase UbiE